MRFRGLGVLLAICAAVIGMACGQKPETGTDTTTASACNSTSSCVCLKSQTWTKVSVAGAPDRWVSTQPSCSGKRLQVLDEVRCDSTGGMDPTCGHDIDSMIVVVGSKRGG